MAAKKVKLDENKLNTYNEDVRRLIELIGFDNARKVVEEFGGIQLYLPSYKSFMRVFRDDLIFQDFNGSNYRELAKKYKLTDMMIRNIIEEQKKISKPNIVEFGQYEQATIFK